MVKTPETLTYLTTWNTGDVAKRAQLISKCFSDKSVYTDPHAAEPLVGATAMIDTFRERLDQLLIPTSQLDMHHNVVRLK